MSFVRLHFRAINPTDPVVGPEPDFAAHDIVVSGVREVLLVDAVQRSRVDAAGSYLWRLYLQPDAGLMLWVAGADVVDGQADPRGTVLIDHGATLGEVSDYFGPWLVGPRPRLALWPAEGLGAGPGIEWLTLGRGALEVYGAMEAVRTAVGGVLAHHRAPLRRDAQRWIGDGVVTRRLNRFLLERDEWEIRELQAYLDLGFSELANILRQLGYETTPGAPERWTRCT